MAHRHRVASVCQPMPVVPRSSAVWRLCFLGFGESVPPLEKVAKSRIVATGIIRSAVLPYPQISAAAVLRHSGQHEGPWPLGVLDQRKGAARFQYKAWQNSMRRAIDRQ